MDGHRFLGRRRAATRRGGGPPPSSSSTLLELETLSAYSALEARAVTLSEDEALVVSRLAELLLADATRAYDKFLSLDNGLVDPRAWKPVKRKDQLCVYKQRKDSSSLGTSFGPRLSMSGFSMDPSASSSSRSVSGDLEATAQAETTLPLMLVAGALPGSLDDAMFGLASATTRELKMNSAYAEDGVMDAEVLTTLEGPTVDDPFRFLGLKWVARRHATSMKKRDLLYLEATGVTTRANGERLGYRILHSVSVRALAQLSASISDSVVRAKATVCELFHETPAVSYGSRLHVFSRGYYDPLGGMMQFVAVNVAAELLLHMAHSAVDCAHLKKVAKAAQLAGRQRRRATSVARKNSRLPPPRMHPGMQDIDEADEATGMDVTDGDALSFLPSMCHICECSLGKMLNRSGAPCTICFHMICSRCSVTKKLRFSWAEATTTHRRPQHGGEAGVTGSTSHSNSQSQATTERSRSRSGSGGAPAPLMRDITEKALNFCLPCVVAANQQSAAQLAIEDMMARTTMASDITPRSTTSSAFRASNAAASLRQRWTRGASIYGARPSYTGSSNGSSSGAFSPAQPRFSARQKAFSMAPPPPRDSAPKIVLYVDESQRQT